MSSFKRTKKTTKGGVLLIGQVKRPECDIIKYDISLSTKKRGYTMADNKEEKTIDIEVDLDEEPVFVERTKKFPS